MTDLMTSVEGQPQRKNWLRREWRLVVGLVLSAVCLFLALRGVSLAALKDALSVARWEWVALATMVVVINTFVRTARWRTLFLPRRLGAGKAWSVLLIGQMLNAVLPARAGEVGRIYFIAEIKGVSRAQALSTVVAEKMTDFVMLALAYLIVTAWLVATPAGLPDWLRDAGASLLPLATLALGGLLLFAYAGRPTWRFLRPALGRLPLRWRTAVDTAVEQAIAAFKVFRRGRAGAQVWSSSFLIWSLMALTNGLVFNAFGLVLSPYVAILLLVVLMSGVGVPRLPGNLGVFPYLCVLVLSLFGVEREVALVYGITLQMAAYMPLIVLGLACMLWENWLLRRSAQRARPYDVPS